MPDAVVRRRFWKSLVNFDRLYRPLTASWQMFDGSVVVGRPLIAHGTGESNPIVVDEDRWTDVRTLIEEAH